MSYYTASKNARFLLKLLEDYCLNGDTYVTKEILWSLCKRKSPQMTAVAFSHILSELLQLDCLHLEGRRLYLTRIWRYENATAQALAHILSHNTGSVMPHVPDTLSLGDITLTDQQRDAIVMASKHQISCILGGAGTGKSTLIHCLAQIFHEKTSGIVLCAPTGKGARNITLRTGYPARTVHSALGKTPDDSDFLTEIQWAQTRLLVVDEASMMSLEMLAGILSAITPLCTVVLVGDPNQLLSVGSGNIMADLLALGVPHCTLTAHHRQSDKTSALAYNVEQFNHCHCMKDLRFDDSFVFHTNLEQAEKSLCLDATQRYLSLENIQVLTPFNASAFDLNRSLQQTVNSNPAIKDTRFRNMDRVMVTENDWKQKVLNGDTGLLHISEDRLSHSFFGFQGQVGLWHDLPQNHSPLALAYAITVHKAQGSEYDTVLVPICKRSPILTRNWIYTAISRGKQKVVLYGDPDIFNQAMGTPARARASMLVVKTRQCMSRMAS